MMGGKMQSINLTLNQQVIDDPQPSFSSRNRQTSERRPKLPAKSPSTVDDLSRMSDTTSTLPPLHQPAKRPSGEMQQLTLQSYERYGSASMHATAVNCLREANHFTRKSWLKQVEISKEMVKQCTKRRIQRAGQGISSMSTPAQRSTGLPECQPS